MTVSKNIQNAAKERETTQRFATAIVSEVTQQHPKAAFHKPVIVTHVGQTSALCRVETKVSLSTIALWFANAGAEVLLTENRINEIIVQFRQPRIVSRS
jgi:hypothetical protein